MKKRSKKIRILVSSIVIGLLNLAFAFARSATGSKVFYHPPARVAGAVSSTTLTFTPSIRSVYDSLRLNLKGMSREAFEYAKKGFSRLVEEGKLVNDSIISMKSNDSTILGNNSINLRNSSNSIDTTKISDSIKINYEKGFVGLKNIGNTCYMNAALQALSHT